MVVAKFGRPTLIGLMSKCSKRVDQFQITSHCAAGAAQWKLVHCYQSKRAPNWPKTFKPKVAVAEERKNYHSPNQYDSLQDDEWALRFVGQGKYWA